MTNNNRFPLILLFIIITATLACSLGPKPLDRVWPFTQAPPEPAATPVQYRVGPTTSSDGLSDLESYRANLIIEFEGARRGQPSAGRLESLMEQTRQPPALRHYLNVNVTSPMPEIGNGISEFYRVEESVYVKKAGQDSWLIFTDQAGPPDQITPAALGLLSLDKLIILPPVLAKAPQLETLDGLSVRHYTFTEADLPDSNPVFEQAQGELWVAAHGNFLMQYVISATVRTVSPLPQVPLFDRGDLNLSYTLTEVNQPFEITPPQVEILANNNQLRHLPRLPDAQLITVFPTLIEYTSAISPVGATLFYRGELAALEWTELQAEIFTEKSRLTYSKEKQALTIIISPAADPGRIKVVLDVAESQ